MKKTHCLVLMWARANPLHQQNVRRYQTRSRFGGASIPSLIELLMIVLLICGVALVVPLFLHSTRSADRSAKLSKPIFRLSRIADDRLCAQCGSTEIVCVNLLTHSKESLFQTHGPPISRSKVSADGSTVMVSLEDREILLFRNRELLFLHPFQAETNADTASVDKYETATEVSLSTNGSTAILILEGTKIRCWDLSSPDPTWNDYVIPNAASRIALTPDGERFVTSTREGRIDLYEAKTGNLLKSLGEFEPVKSELVFSENGETLAFVGSQTLSLMEMSSLTATRQIPIAHWTGSQCVAITADGRLVAVGNGRVGVLVFNSVTGETVLEISKSRRHHSPQRLEFSRTGDILYSTSSNDSSVRIWSVSPFREQESLEI